MTHRFKYDWTLKDAEFTKDKGSVFSCFACGGGSTMGYKLAGFDVIGMNEIDPKMAEVYIKNHEPRFSFVESITDFKDREDLPDELFNLDILDGSPPCSSFSLAGNRSKDWGKEKKFREGQAKQVLDTLFFDFIDLAKRLQPKVVVAENVKGILLGEAKKYVIKIYKQFDKAGYHCQHFLLDASVMGVPQRRERVFFVCLRKDLSEPFMKQVDMFTQKPAIDMIFNEQEVPFKKIEDKEAEEGVFKLSPQVSELWHKAKAGESFSKYHPTGAKFGCDKIKLNQVVRTLLCQDKNRDGQFHPTTHRTFTFNELCKISTFPKDFKVEKKIHIYRFAGMSVPPVMTAQIASRIDQFWLSKIHTKNI